MKGRTRRTDRNSLGCSCRRAQGGCMTSFISDTTVDCANACILRSLAELEATQG